MTTSFLDNYKCEGEILKVFKYPAAILKKKSLPVEKFDDKLVNLCKDMLYTMYMAPGIGLAAPQVGIIQKVFVMDINYKRQEVTRADNTEDYELTDFKPQIFINPVLSHLQEEIIYEEGCLSLPGIFEEVTRARLVTVDYQDINGDKHTLDASDVHSVCIQHENDHLDGIVFLDRLSLLKKNLLKNKFLKSMKAQQK